MAELRSEPRSLVGLRMHHSLGDLPPLRMFSTQELVCRLTIRHCAPLPLPPIPDKNVLMSPGVFLHHMHMGGGGAV